jgi:sulfite reductase (NADPH) flavoprotein alpha-component
MTMHVLPTIEIVPSDAPFTAGQRLWLNHLFAEMLASRPSEASGTLPPAPGEDDSTPWKDPALPLGDRLALAQDRPVRWRLMAAMAQQDCGQCGSSCADYSKAIFEQAEDRLNLCVPGGKATARALKALVEEMGGGVIDPEAVAAKAATAPDTSGEGPGPGRSRAHPVTAHFVSAARLNGEGSEKHTYHVEIDLAGTGLDYAAGDSLGVFPKNDPALADAVIAAIDAPADFPIAGEPLRQVLIERMSLGPAPDALFEFISYLTGGARRQKAKALAKGEDPDGDAETLDVLAALEKFPGIRPDPEALIEVLEPLQPRLYSISSSPRTNPGRVSLTVDAVAYELAGRSRLGVASTFLGGRIHPGDPLQIYVQKAHGFGLPGDAATPIIMVGPGTGVAPFRAFLHERMATNTSGPAWLFFGHQRQAHDFFYADEWEMLRRRGTLTHLSLAWSRDPGGKSYVQDRMREEGAELWRWLDEGAHFYVCGDAKRMAKDVEATLADIFKTHGGLDAAAAAARLVAMRREGRLQLDVY